MRIIGGESWLYAHAIILSAFCGACIWIGAAFDTDALFASMPIRAAVIGFLIIAVAHLALMLRNRDDLPMDTRSLGLMLGLGVVGRVALLASDPILEVDFYRYLWDGALTAHGFNPYTVAPSDISRLAYDDLRLELSKAAGEGFARISYPDLKTVYPPVAQAAFALAHWLSPYSLTAWRLVCIAGDLATVALLIQLLKACDRPPIWAAFYWLNPLVLKEVVNSAHMEAVLTPLVLGALVLSLRGRSLAATGVLGLAIGTKLWPVMLLPLILRPLFDRPRVLAAAVALLGVMMLAFAWPVWLGGIDQRSGFVGFATDWATNSALFPLLDRIAAMLAGAAPGSVVSGRIVRALAALSVAGLAVWLCRHPLHDARELLDRAYLIVTALLLLSPAQFPWYILWVLPLAALFPQRWGWQVAAALMPLYYAAFYFHGAGTYRFYETWVVWLLWLPIWTAHIYDLRRRST